VLKDFLFKENLANFVLSEASSYERYCLHDSSFILKIKVGMGMGNDNFEVSRSVV